MKPYRPLLLLLLIPLDVLAQNDQLINGVDSTDVVRRIIVDSTGKLLTATSDTCTTVLESVTSVGVTSTSVPSAVLASRKSILICNSPENTSSPVLKCRGDGTAPVIGNGTAGQVLNKGDCITYYSATRVSCIADTAATAASVTECS